MQEQSQEMTNIRSARDSFLALALASVAGLCMATAPAAAQTVLINNGPFITGQGIGSGGADVSQTEQSFFAFGFEASRNASAAVTDDFYVPCGTTWTISELEVYAYQGAAAATGPATIAEAYVAIYDGVPGLAGTNLIYGGLGSPILPIAEFLQSNGQPVYRVDQNNVGTTSRAVQRVRIPLVGVPALGSATEARQYWFAVTLSGTGLDGPWIIPVAPSRIDDNARGTSDIGAAAIWPFLDANGSSPGVLRQDIPFVLRGELTGSACLPPNAVDVTIPGDGSFGGAAQLAPTGGEVRWFRFTLAQPIARATVSTLGSRLDIDSEGSTLTVPQGAPEVPDDTFMALYRENGTRVLTDDDDGSGELSQISIGQPIQFSAGVAQNFDGRDGPNLAAGVYYVGLCARGPSTFALPSFAMGTDAQATGDLELRIRRTDGIAQVSPSLITPAVTVDTLAQGVQVVSLTAQESVVAWVKFTLPTDLEFDGALDIYTEGTLLTPENNLALGLYTAAGNLIARDYRSGSDSLAMLSFGGGFRPRVNTSWNFYGQDGGVVLAGDYYLAVVPGDSADFGPVAFSVVPGNEAQNRGPLQITFRYAFDATGDVAAPPVISPTHDFGVLSNTRLTRNVPVSPETVTYFRFELPVDATSGGYLLIDTEGTAMVPISDTTIRLYNEVGESFNLGDADLDGGSLFLSQLSFGPGQYLLATPPLAQRHNSRDGIQPAPGIYYLAVRTGNEGGSEGTDWNMNADALNGGSLVVNISFVRDAATITANQAPSSSNDFGPVQGTQTVARFFGFQDVAWYTFEVPSGITNADWLDIDTAGTIPEDANTTLALFSASGVELTNDDNSGPLAMAQMSFGSAAIMRPNLGDGAADRLGQNGLLPPGTYWIAVSVEDDANLFLPRTRWDVRTEHFAALALFVNLRSSFSPPPPACVGDIVGGDGNPPADGNVDGNDFTAFLNAFGAQDALADIVGGDGNPPADGNVDGNDFQAFLNAFGAGC